MTHTIALLTVLLLALTACGPQGQAVVVEPDTNSGGDDSLAGARGLFDDVVNDSVDAPEGDNTDFKYVDIDARGTLNLRVRFHSMDVTGAVSLMNEFGDVLAERAYSQGGDDLRIEDFSVLPGRYYVRVHAAGGKERLRRGPRVHSRPRLDQRRRGSVA